MNRLLHFEHKQQPLAPARVYYNRVLRNIVVGFSVLNFFLGVGVVGYHLTCGYGWLDSLLNASMILSGMGPTNPIDTDAGKWFASLYALVSGVVFITTIGLILAPIVHRFLHKLHLQEEK